MYISNGTPQPITYLLTDGTTGVVDPNETAQCSIPPGDVTQLMLAPPGGNFQIEVENNLLITITLTTTVIK